MIKPRHAALATIALVLGLAVMGPSYAQTNEPSDTTETQQMVSVKLSAADAATAAQTALGGRAMSVDLENGIKAPSYQVTLVLADGSELEALVDATSGSVTKAPTMTGDHGDHGHTENNNEQEKENEGEGGENAEG